MLRSHRILALLSAAASIEARKVQRNKENCMELFDITDFSGSSLGTGRAIDEADAVVGA